MATTVFASEDPAVVRNYAVLFAAALPVAERVRISYNHVNGMSEPLTLSLVVLNDSDEPAPLDFLGGYAGPDVDTAAVGHTATASFFRERFSGTSRSEVLAARARVALIARGFAAQECLCGIFEIENRSARPMRVAVVACGIGIAPSDAVGMFAWPPLAQSSTTDDEARVERNALLPFSLPESSAFAGVLSTFDVVLANDSGADVTLDIVLDTKGFSSATLTIDGSLFEVARTPPHTPAIVETVVVPAGGRTISIVIATDLNAPGPGVVSFAPKIAAPQPSVRFGFAPPPQVARAVAPAVPPLPAAAVTMDSSGSSARGVAAEVGARPPAAATSRLAEPLASAVIAEAPSLTPHHYDVIVEISQRSRPIPALSRAAVQWLLWKVGVKDASSGGNDATHPFFFASMTAPQIVALLAADDELVRRSRMRPLIARIWQDHVVTAAIIDSIPTVKADAVHTSFSALGEGIVWAVIDSGVERHPHFEQYQNLFLPDGLSHRDYLGTAPADIPINNLVDEFGHGTHVAGIIAGVWNGKTPPIAATRVRDEGTHRVSYVGSPLVGNVGGVAPKCKILSMRVLDAMGTGFASAIISALEDVLAINDYGRNIRIHGVNLSVGYTFNPDWEACGATPLCTTVDRLVASGVIVVVAAGNSGDVLMASEHGGQRQTGAGISINDPGNAERAITVGSCYKKAPHTLGIAASSSKGPTGDGRPKPDLVAPGERVLSCAAAVRVAAAGCTPPISYIEDSGTSMAAPHVSGAAAAYLSARTEFVGRPDDIKSLMTSCATDLRRDKSFQGAGLIDVFRMFVNS
jgi:subtilisin family serine protease